MPTVDVWEACRAAVATLVQAIGLTDPATNQPVPVYKNLWDVDAGLSFPCFQVTADGPEPDIAYLDSATVMVTYPVVVLFKVSGEAGRTDDNAAYIQKAYKEAQNALRAVPTLPGAPTVFRKRVRPLRHLDRAEREKFQRAEHALVVFCDSAEPDAGVAA